MKMGGLIERGAHLFFKAVEGGLIEVGLIEGGLIEGGLNRAFTVCV